MSDVAIHLPSEFEWLVRDALLHLYDLAYLQVHPLLGVVSDDGTDSMFRAKRLRQALLDAIEDLQPNVGSTAPDRSSRTHRILELRYIEGHDVNDVIVEVNLSKSQYHREHHRALHAVTLLLWERWQLADRWQTLVMKQAQYVSSAHDLARAEAEHLVASDATSRVNPVEVLQRICTLLEPLCVRQDIRFELDLPDFVAPIRGERVALRQALLSILAHAVNSTSHTTLELAVLSGARRVEISIRGPSMDSRGSSRLGIEESRHFVEALKGCLTFRPAPSPGKHWTIDLSFPTADCTPLLVVDNNIDFIRLVERYLMGRRWEVVGASDVEQAFALARNHGPAVILLDVVMPGRDGWDLLVDLKTTPVVRDIPVIVCSVLDESEVAISLGASAYLQKPVHQHQLIQMLDRLLMRQGDFARSETRTAMSSITTTLRDDAE